MSLVRHAQVCDFCGKRGEEYSFGFTLPCRSCGRRTCRKCAAYFDPSGKSECYACKRERYELEAQAQGEAWHD